MNATPEPKSEIAASRLGFGCASLMRVTSAAERDRLLRTAFDLGFRHYDVARLYGLGAAESALGPFARAHRDQITVATKFGLEPSGGLGRMGALQKPARALMNRVPAVRRAIKKRAGSMVAEGSYDVETARRSLDTSLLQLGLDSVDFLFVHGPGPGSAIDAPALRAFFESAVQAGKIRRWGVSYDEVPGFDLVAMLGDPAVLQVRETVFDHRPRAEPYLSFGVLGEPLEQLRTGLARDPELHRRWSAALGFDPASGPQLAKLLLTSALRANERGTVLYSSVRTDRLAEAAAVLGDPSSEAEVSALRSLVDAGGAAFAA